MNVYTEQSMLIFNTPEILFIDLSHAQGDRGPLNPPQDRHEQTGFLWSCHEALGDSSSEDSEEGDPPQLQVQGKRQVRMTERAK
jgi:hypothetical protein